MKLPYELFGSEVGDGWVPIVKEAVEELEEIHARNIKNPPDWFRGSKEDSSFADWYGKSIILQVKEKYGTLRIYTAYLTDEIDEIITKAERDCRETCEVCGSKDSVEIRGICWYKTLCEICAEEQKRTATTAKSNNRKEKTND